MNRSLNPACPITVATSCGERSIVARRRGLTILELLVVMAVISVLVALILPAVQAARESARRIECSNNLKQIGIALHGYHDLLSSFPPGWRDDHQQYSAYAWADGLLPLLEQHEVFNSIHFESRLDDPAHAPIADFNLKSFQCPSDVARYRWELRDHSAPHSVLMELPHSNYVSVFGTCDPDGTVLEGDGPFIRNRSFRAADIEAGLSNTIFVGERAASHLPATWFGFIYQGEEAQSRVSGYVNDPPGADGADESEFSSRHSNGAYFLWGDGHVSFISQFIDRTTYRSYGTRRAE